MCLVVFGGTPCCLCCILFAERKPSHRVVKGTELYRGKKKKEARAISRCTADFNTNPPWRRVSCYSVARGVGPLGVSLPRHVRRQLPRLGVRKCEAGLQGDGGRWLGRVQVAKYGSVFFGGTPFFGWFKGKLKGNPPFWGSTKEDTPICENGWFPSGFPLNQPESRLAVFGWDLLRKHVRF